MSKNLSQASELIQNGYNLVSSHDGYTTFEKPKKFSWGWFLFWFISTFIGGFVYLLYFIGKQNEKITVKDD